MPVTTQHELYVEMDPQWLMMRDILAGEQRIKSRGTTYLPKPDGMRAREDATGDKDPYLNFKARAQVPDWLSPALRSMIGLAFKADPVIELPPRLESLRDRATPSGEALIDLARRALRNVLLTGRYGILPDIADNGGQPVLLGYRAESIINWREAAESGDRRLELAVLAEKALSPANTDIFAPQYDDQYRVLQLIEGRYQVELWRQTVNTDTQQPPPAVKSLRPGGGYIADDDARQPLSQRTGQPLEFIPLVIIGSTGLLADPDDIPLIGMGRAVIACYQHSASYEHALYLCSQPTPVLTGVDREDLDEVTGKVIGSGAVWCLPSPDSDAKYLEVSQTGGLSELRLAMARDRDQAAEAGARVMDQDGVESGEARKARQTDQQATLHSCADTVSRGLTQALRNLAVWHGDDPDAVRFDLTADYSDADVDAALLRVLSEGVAKATTPRSVLYEALRLAKLTELSDEDLDETIEQEGATGMGLFGAPNNDPPEPKPETPPND